MTKSLNTFQKKVSIKKERKNYSLLEKEAFSLLKGEYDLVSNMSNLSSFIFYSLSEINSVTFYRLKNHELLLGPFQGKPACVHIPIGKGVCGTVAKNLKSEIVDNVLNFPGHIACDAASRSEIVVPIFFKNHFWGVLDLDSPIFSRFDKEDEKFLFKIASFIFQEKNRY